MAHLASLSQSCYIGKYLYVQSMNKYVITCMCETSLYAADARIIIYAPDVLYDCMLHCAGMTVANITLYAKL
jgi:hypothetical protein